MTKDFKFFASFKQGKIRKRGRVPDKLDRVFIFLLENQPFTTIFTRRFGTTIIFTICLPLVCSTIFASANANFSSSSFEASGEATTRERSLPLICTGISISSAFANSSLNSGNGAKRARLKPTLTIRNRNFTRSKCCRIRREICIWDTFAIIRSATRWLGISV